MAHEDAIATFTREFTDRGCWRWKWHGFGIAKNPMDLAVYQEILWERRPSLIVECGTYSGGSALFLAEQLDVIGDGQVISIDIDPQTPLPQHPRLTFVTANSADPATLSGLVQSDQMMVILDSDHRYAHVLAELELWAPLVSVGQYLIVEDTCINGHPVLPDWGPGPFEAVQKFLETHPEFKVDASCERFLSTFNPSGYLLRTSGACPPAPRTI